MSAPAAALVVFLILVAVVVVVLAVLYLVKRVEAFKGTVQEMSSTLDPALERLRRDSEVTQNELRALQESTGAVERHRPRR